jgi:hypothetical protein
MYAYNIPWFNLSFSFILPPLLLKTISTGLILIFSCRYTNYIDHIHPLSPSLFTLPSPTSTHIFFFFFVILGLELRASNFLGRSSTVWATLLALFAMVILEIGSCSLLRLAWTVIFLYYASHCHWDGKCIPPHPTFLHWDGVSQTLLPGLALNCSPFHLSLPDS